MHYVNLRFPAIPLGSRQALHVFSQAVGKKHMMLYVWHLLLSHMGALSTQTADSQVAQSNVFWVILGDNDAKPQCNVFWFLTKNMGIQS